MTTEKPSQKTPENQPGRMTRRAFLNIIKLAGSLLAFNEFRRLYLKHERNSDEESKKIIKKCFGEYHQIYQALYVNDHLANGATSEELEKRFYDFTKKYADGLVIRYDNSLGERTPAEIINDTIKIKPFLDRQLFIPYSNETRIFENKDVTDFGSLIAEIAHAVRHFNLNFAVDRINSDKNKAKEKTKNMPAEEQEQAVDSIVHFESRNEEYDTHYITEKVILMYLFQPGNSKVEFEGLNKKVNEVCRLVEGSEFKELFNDFRLKLFHQNITLSNTKYFLEANTANMKQGLADLNTFVQNPANKDVTHSSILFYPLFREILVNSSNEKFTVKPAMLAKQAIDNFFVSGNTDEFRNQIDSLKELFEKEKYLQNSIQTGLLVFLNKPKNIDSRDQMHINKLYSNMNSASDDEQIKTLQSEILQIEFESRFENLDQQTEKNMRQMLGILN